MQKQLLSLFSLHRAPLHALSIVDKQNEDARKPWNGHRDAHRRRLETRIRRTNTNQTNIISSLFLTPLLEHFATFIINKKNSNIERDFDDEWTKWIHSSNINRERIPYHLRDDLDVQMRWEMHDLSSPSHNDMRKWCNEWRRIHSRLWIHAMTIATSIVRKATNKKNKHNSNEQHFVFVSNPIETKTHRTCHHEEKQRIEQHQRM